VKISARASFPHSICRTGFATLSAMFCISTKAKVSDGIANPVRQSWSDKNADSENFYLHTHSKKIMSRLPSFEQEIKQYFEHHRIAFDDNSASFKKLDFGFGDAKTKRYFSFDVKEKRQHYAVRNWPETDIPEEHLFIIDDLAARKILAYSPNSGLVVRDNLHRKYFFFSVVDLWLMPRQRVNRDIRKNVPGVKGKWLTDLRNGHSSDALTGVFAGIEAYLNRREDIFLNILECYGDYVGEDIPKGGIVRRPEHWSVDVSETR